MDRGKLVELLTNPKLLTPRGPQALAGHVRTTSGLGCGRSASLRVLHLQRGAANARALGYSAISVIELGVAGGNGLVTLEETAAAVEECTHVQVQTFGFDAGSGMPAPADYRDLPYVWQPGFFHMDEAALRARLTRSQPFIGDVRETIPEFTRRATFHRLVSSPSISTTTRRRSPRCTCSKQIRLGDCLGSTATSTTCWATTGRSTRSTSESCSRSTSSTPPTRPQGRADPRPGAQAADRRAVERPGVRLSRLHASRLQQAHTSIELGSSPAVGVSRSIGPIDPSLRRARRTPRGSATAPTARDASLRYSSVKSANIRSYRPLAPGSPRSRPARRTAVDMRCM